jgi:hypothetical protein
LLVALGIGFFERWSAVVVRYLGLVLLAPATLLYFGWREFGYLPLSVGVPPTIGPVVMRVPRIPAVLSLASV